MCRFFLTVVLICASVASIGQARKTQEQAGGLSKERSVPLPYVFELLDTRYRFENNGTGRKEVIAKVRILNAMGVLRLSEKTFGYRPFSEELQILYVRVKKEDGTLMSVDTNVIQEPPNGVPPKRDYEERRVRIPGLSVGDLVEYDAVTIIHRPLGPSEFYVDHSFQPSGVLNEQLEVDVPRDRAVKVKGIPSLKTWETADARRRVYHWESQKTRPRQVGVVPYVPDRTPDVQVSSFLRWEDVGRWYEGLERNQRAVTPEIKAKAEELTIGLNNDSERVEALYDFVARKIKYRSLPLYVAGFVPHSASETLRDQYGDCKDKVTLLSALLEAEWLQASSVLINPERKIDLDVPSPWPFTHVIMMLHIGKEEVWMDPSVAVLPFRMLTPSIRGKEGLVMPPGRRAHFEATPAVSTVPNAWSEEIQGEVSKDGTLEATVNVTARGESELSLRQAFSGPVEASWPIIVLRIVKGIARSDEITEVKITEPTVSEPFTLSFRLKREHSASFSKGSDDLKLPLADFDLPPAEEQGVMDARGGWHRLETEPVRLGLPFEQSYKIVLKLPSSCSVVLPKPVRYEHPGGTYRADYRWDGNSLIVERGLVVSRDHIAARLRGAYAVFRKNVLEDMKSIISARVVASTSGLETYVTAPNSTALLRCVTIL